MLATICGRISVFKLVIQLRKQHPAICRSRFWRDQVKWYGIRGEVDMAHHSHTLAYCIHGQQEHDDDIYVMINAYWQPLEFYLQEAGHWHLVIDTSLNSPEDICEPEVAPLFNSDHYLVTGRLLVVLIKKRP